MKRVISMITALSMIMTLLIGIVPVSAEESGTIKVTAIEFGDYPQDQVTSNEANVYSQLEAENGWVNGDKTINGIKYRRINRNDSTRTSNANYYSEYFGWSDSNTYCYFKYEPIKWKILESNGDDAFLLSEIGLDDQVYNTTSTSITWENCTLRTWLNDTFLNRAFSSSEQGAIIKRAITNDDNIEYGTEGGNNTTDKVFLLSESEVYGDNAVKYGFAKDYNKEDEARVLKVSTYAWAMGVQRLGWEEKCNWLLRSPGEVGYAAANVGANGNVGIGGNDVTSTDYAVRPALHINLKSSVLGKIGTYITNGIHGNDVELSENNFVYDGSYKTPTVSIEGLAEGKDFYVSYSNNINAGEAVVTITGKGNYSGTIIKTFNIEQASLSEKEAVLSSSSYTYDGSEKKPTVSIEGFANGKDYIVEYLNNIKVGTATVIITGKDNCFGSIVKTFSINKADISDTMISLLKTSYVYSGSTNKPEVKIEGLSKGIDYTISYKNNTKCGKAKVTITGKGNYTGTCTKAFTIKPAKAKLSKATARGKSISVKINSQKASGVTGYEIYYKKSGASAKNITTTSISKKITGLTKGKKYTVKVRAYKTIDGKKVYGAYSASKTVKVK